MALVNMLADTPDVELFISNGNGSNFMYSVDTFSRGYHEYMNDWLPEIGDNALFCRRDQNNQHDRDAVAIIPDSLWGDACCESGVGR